MENLSKSKSKINIPFKNDDGDGASASLIRDARGASPSPPFYRKTCFSLLASPSASASVSGSVSGSVSSSVPYDTVRHHTEPYGFTLKAVRLLPHFSLFAHISSMPPPCRGKKQKTLFSPLGTDHRDIPSFLSNPSRPAKH